MIQSNGQVAFDYSGDRVRRMLAAVGRVGFVGYKLFTYHPPESFDNTAPRTRLRKREPDSDQGKKPGTQKRADAD